MSDADGPAQLPGLPPLSALEPFGEGDDWEARLYLHAAVRRVYERCAIPNSDVARISEEGIAELRGATQALRSIAHLTFEHTVELLDPVVLRDVVSAWPVHKVIWG